MTHIIQLEGTDKQLYPLIGPLVMNPDVLRYNNRYPFKTGKKFRWYIDVNKQNEAIGFIPIENKASECLINNYYAQKEGHDEILTDLLQTVCADYTGDTPHLTALVQTVHKELFIRLGFSTIKEWKLYIKMERK